jgi:RND superfamily putative drug exporter
MIAGSVGSDFTEEFKLPASDSPGSLRPARRQVPAQSGDTATIVYKATPGVESPAVKQKMEGVFAEVAKFPHVSEVASPYDGERRGGDQRRRQDRLRDGPVRRPNDEARQGRQEASIDSPRAARRRLQVELGGQPIEEARAKKKATPPSRSACWRRSWSCC